MLEITAVEVANYLAKNGHAAKGAAILSDLIVRNPSSLSANGVSALARIAYKGKNWREAAALWRVIVGADKSDVEARVKLAHCLVELDLLSEAEACGATAKALFESQRGRQPVVDVEALLAEVYEQICLHFLGHALSKAEDLSRICALPSSYLANVLGRDPDAGFSESLGDEAIVRRLNGALGEWEESGRTVPYVQLYRAMPGGGTKQGFPENKKVLLILRKYFLGRADSREHELAIFFQTSAKAAGFAVVFFAADPFLNPTAFKPEQQYSELDRLARLILSARPDLVIFDDFCNQQIGGEYIGPEVYKNVFGALRAQHPFKLVGFYPDSWTPASLATIESVSSFLDVVWHLSFLPDQPNRGESRAKMFWSPIPYPEKLFRVGSNGKDIMAGFVGSLFEYNYPRGVWLTLIKRRQIPCQLFLSTHTLTGSTAGVTAEEYAAFMSRLKMSVNFSARTITKKIMTGRAWESIISKSLLLEEDNDEIKRFFVPFVHYIPFKNIGELTAYLSFFERNDDLRCTIAERAFGWFQQVFSKERIWSDLIATALE